MRHTVSSLFCSSLIKLSKPEQPWPAQDPPLTLTHAPAHQHPAATAAATATQDLHPVVTGTHEHPPATTTDPTGATPAPLLATETETETHTPEAVPLAAAEAPTTTGPLEEEAPTMTAPPAEEAPTTTASHEDAVPNPVTPPNDLTHAPAHPPPSEEQISIPARARPRPLPAAGKPPPIVPVLQRLAAEGLNGRRSAGTRSRGKEGGRGGGIVTGKRLLQLGK